MPGQESRKEYGDGQAAGPPGVPVSAAIFGVLVGMFVGAVLGGVFGYFAGQAGGREAEEHARAAATEAASLRQQLAARAAPADGPPRPAPLPRDQFRALVLGKTPDGVTGAVGKPDETSGGGPARAGAWTYHGRTADPATGKPDAAATLTFENGAVASVTFR